MMKEIDKDVVYVRGRKNGALYCFNTSKIYSINEIACDILDKYVSKIDLDTAETAYLELLVKNDLLNMGFAPKEYFPEKIKNTHLEMAWLEVTQNCNLKCVHCYEGEFHKSEKEVLNINQWKNVVDQLIVLGIQRVIIIGGEPCCYPKICQLIEYIGRFDIHITLFTNATLITDEIRTCIIKNKISVKVSIYGHNSEVHDSVTTVKGSFDKTVSNIQDLLNNNIEVIPAVVAMKENQEYMDEIKKFVVKMGMKYTRFDVIRNVYGGTQNKHTPDKKEIVAYAKYTNPNFSITKEQFDKANNINSCWYGKLSIIENGNVIPCEFERNIIYGNVLKTSISEILERDELKKHWFLSYSFIEPCNQCEYRFACKDCRALALSIKGNVYDKNPRCQYDPINGVWNK